MESIEDLYFTTNKAEMPFSKELHIKALLIVAQKLEELKNEFIRYSEFNLNNNGLNKNAGAKNGKSF